MSTYDHKKIEKKWQKKWQTAKLYKTPDTVKGKKNSYLLVEFPYPSGNLHVGHWYAFAVPDILARMQRMQGKNVLYPIGFDAFGLPAENAAIKNKLNPRTWTLNNIEYMKKQIRSMGTSFDWSREIVTCDPAYYKWTQWLFLQFFKAGLVYRKQTAVNWCPSCKTVLANEQVVGGACERCGTEVVQKQMLQWNIKITDYADRLIDDLKDLDWPEQIKESQRNWIGRSEGAEIDFGLDLGKKYKFVMLHGYKSKGNSPRWKWLKSELEKFGHEVIIPILPNTDHPKESEQVAAALNATTYDENTILVGHSLGGLVALKVTEKLKTKIARLVVISAAMNPAYPGYVDRPFRNDFDWTIDAEKVKAIAPDRVVISDLQETDRMLYLSDLAKEIGAHLVETKAVKKHFVGDREPDMLMWLRPTIRVFTTRADTLYGATYLVLAPEHPWVTLAWDSTHDILKNKDEVGAYIEQAKKKTEIERLTVQNEKTGVELQGVRAINPATGEQIPVYVADYVLGHYGTGAIMAVPAHDERDHEFAKKFNLPINQVVAPIVHGVTGSDAWREGEPVKERHAVMCILKHWERDEFLCLQWKHFSEIKTFVSGGIEKGENPVVAGSREIREETGYQNPLFVRSVGQVQFVEFYHQAKKTNARIKMRYLYFELQNEEQRPILPEEDAKHTLFWKKRSEVLSFINFNERNELWRQFEHGDKPYTGEGILANSGEFDGMATDGARKVMTERFGRMKTTYKLRDWIVSRQRYWGVPIPIIHCPACGAVAVEDKNLPVKLPEVKGYLPEGSGKSPLAKVKSFVNVKCPECGGKAERETDTLDTFVDSSWYFLRYIDPNNKTRFADPKKLEKWMPVNLYSGGAEHTTMHVLYSRFWQKAMYDLGLVKDNEPYRQRMNRSLIMGPDGQKMSKSRGNVIDPDDVVATLGSDTVRMYLAFIGPYNEVSSYPWNPDGVVGVRRFLERVWRAQATIQPNHNVVGVLGNLLHKTIKKVGEDIVLLKFNTAISALMIFLNAIEKTGSIGNGQWETFLKLLAPFAPHMADELWELSGHKKSIHLEEWPEFDAARLKDDTVTIAVQINGKTRGTVNVATESDKIALELAARGIVAARLDGKNVLRTVVVSGRLVNFVVEE